MCVCVRVPGSRFGDHLEGTDLWGRGYILNQSHLICLSTSADGPDSTSIDGDWIVQLRVSLNGQDYSAIGLPFFYYSHPRLSHTAAPSSLVANQHWLASPQFPYGGPLAGGTLLEVHGRDSLEAAHLGEAQCSFDGIRVAATFVSHRRVLCVSPLLDLHLSAYTVAVSVILNGVSLLPDDAGHRVAFVVYEPPIVDSIVPSGAPTHESVVIRLRGANMNHFAWFPR